MLLIERKITASAAATSTYTGAKTMKTATQSAVQHTPGPWAHHTNGAHTYSVTANDCHGAKCYITTINKFGDGEGGDHAPANAQLIAAAPCLLQALREIQANPNDPRAHRTALDAIAKAMH
jgi:hypothetical protein